MLSEESILRSLRKSRRKYYNTWKPMYCAALDEYISFNAKGFSHLNFRTNNTPRSHKEAIYKRILREIEYWAIVAIVGKKNVKIKVILRRIGKGKIHFWSIMKL